MLRKHSSDMNARAPFFNRALLLSTLCAVLLSVSGLRDNAVAQQTSKETQTTITALVMLSPAPTVNEKAFWETRLALLESEFILGTALQQPEILNSPFIQSQSHPIEWLREKLVAIRIPNSPVVRLQLKCPKSDTAAAIQTLDAVIAVYRKDMASQENVKNDEKIKNLGRLHKELAKELQEKFERYQTLAEEFGDAESQTTKIALNMLINEIRLIQTQIIKKKDDLVEITVNKELAVQKLTSASAIERAVAKELDKDPMMANYQAEQYALSSQIRQLKRATKDGAPDQIKRLEQQMRQLQQDEYAYRQQAGEEIRQALKTAPNEGLQQVMTEFILRRNSIVKDITELEAQLEKKLAEIEQKGTRAGKLSMLSSEIEQLQEVESEMAHKLQTWSIEHPVPKTSQQTIILIPATITSGSNFNE